MAVDEDLQNAIVSKPYRFEESTFTEPIPKGRVIGDSNFIETFAGLLKPFFSFEDVDNRVE